MRRRELVAAAWPDGAIVNENTLDAYVGRLRRKLRALGADRADRDRARRRLRPAVNLRGRVTLATVVTLGVGLAVVGVALNLLLDNRLTRRRSTRCCANRAGALLATLDTSGPRLRVHDDAGDAVLDEQAWVFDARGRAVERPPVSDESQTRGDGARAAWPRRPSASIEDRARLLAVPAFDGGERRVGTVVVGVSLAPVRAHRAPRRARHARCCALFVLAAGALLARRAVGAALRPVADMTAQAADWSEHDLDRRFALGAPRDELTALAATLDGLLGRLAAALRHEQRFSAEMAHELRTPLSGVRAEAELALRTAPQRRRAARRARAGAGRAPTGWPR